MVTSPAQVLRALSAMTVAGASDALLGAAVREWLSGEVMPPEPVVRASPPPPQVTPAPSPAPPPVRPSTLSKEKKEVAPSPEIVVFTDGEGSRSSVSIAPADWTQLLSRHRGDVSAARAAVRQIAPKAPPGENRSQWVRAQLLGPSLKEE